MHREDDGRGLSFILRPGGLFVSNTCKVADYALSASTDTPCLVWYLQTDRTVVEIRAPCWCKGSRMQLLGCLWVPNKVG